ncbi:enterobactin synthase subunit F [Erwinia sp.]|uniref:enterobactin synthase subunit F n=1 Tax=Erwinia citreus TaxID=558 RepID=UPI00289FABE3|nr:enterobactin synthase subunit F [Erwinia sp.]
MMPLVAAQSGIWMAEQLSPQVNAWSVAHYVELNGELNEPLLCQAVVRGMNEADTLRMRFTERDGVPMQWVDTAADFTLPECIDLRQHPDPVAAALARMQQDLSQDLRISSGSPIYCHLLFRLSEKRWYWYQRFHHLAVDGFSFTAITRRIAEIYTALQADSEPKPSPFVSFSEVVEEYDRYNASSTRQRDAAFWKEQVSQLPMPASLSPLPLNGQSATTHLIRQHVQLNREDFHELQAQSQLGAAELALALVAVWLGRLSARAEYSAGFIFMRRLGSAALSATGPVLNVLPVAIRLDPLATLPQLAERLQQQLKKVRRHQRYDAEQIQRDTGRPGETLFGPVINLKMFDYRLDFAGTEGTTHQLASGPVRDLEIALYPDEQGNVSLEILANAERYEAETLRTHLDRLPLLLSQFAYHPTISCAQVELLHPQEKKRLRHINDTAVEVPQTTLSSLIKAQAQRTPDGAALADERHNFTYREMRQQVTALAAELQKRGVKVGDIVAVALPRSVFLSLSLQAIVELGAAWLPLDTGYPTDRLCMMLEEANPRLLITTKTQTDRFAQLENLQTFCYHDPLPTADLPACQDLSRPHHTAYVIYTSGSTGRPKGVMVGQQAIVNRLLWMQNHYPLTRDDVVLQKTPCSFDVSVWEFFWPFLTGAQLVMAPPEAHRDPQALQALFRRYGVTTTHFVPSMLAAFVTELHDDQAVTHCASLRQVFCSGEALPTELCRQWQNKTAVPLHNLYGPTEAAVDVSWYPAFGEALANVTGASVPIGYPVWNTGLRILDSNMQPVPPGVAGDLYLTGVQLAQGYLARADLTASRFIADPEGDGTRMYRTGDVARWLENGAVEYLGRSDDQLKIRGQRIELGEIDRALLSLDNVAQAVTHACVLGSASASGGDQRQLVGYVVAVSGELDTTGLREQLSDLLPAHMVPVVLVQLEAFPLSANGKLDRKALPLVQLAHAAGRVPEGRVETEVAAAFARLLECEIRSVNDDFFALGGHSLLAMRLAVDLRRRLNRPVTPGLVMVASTVGALAEKLTQQSEEEAGRAGMETILPLRRSHGPALFCFHPASGFAWQFSILQRYLDVRWSLIGIQSPRPHGPMQQAETLEEVCEQHLATLRGQQPHGPYYLLGYSLGGTLAHAIAARLQAEGEKVAFLGLLDTWPPETQNWSQDQPQDAEVLAEIAREREAFMAAQASLRDSLAASASQALFGAIEGNYGDAVRLLATAKSRRFAGAATLFVAQKTLKPGQDVQTAWAPWLDSLQTWPVECAHVDIISAEAFTHIGPRLNHLLDRATR